eukprot:743542-Lingulodinium_polyedra.AAC.1
MVATCNQHNPLRYQCGLNPVRYEITLVVMGHDRIVGAGTTPSATLRVRCVWNVLQIDSGITLE